MSSFSKSRSNHDNNICVICLEPLLKAKDDDDDGTDPFDRRSNSNSTTSSCDIGTTVPCGHPCHVSCWNSWAECHKKPNHKTDDSDDDEDDDDDDDDKNNPRIPCPTCQQSTKSFVKIFLRPEIIENTNKSFSSSSSSSCGTSSDTDDEDIIVIDESAKAALPAATSATATTATIPTKRKYQKKGGGGGGGKNRKKKAVTAVKKTSKKAQYYKERWLGKIQEVKALKLEAKNRRKCHHDDLIDLERSQLLNFRLMKQLESTIKAAKFSRNAVACFCFGIGWYLSKKFGTS